MEGGKEGDGGREGWRWREGGMEGGKEGGCDKIDNSWVTHQIPIFDAL